MSYEIRRSKEIPGIDISGQPYVMPLELPMFEGWNEELGKQASVSFNSFLRHAAVHDWMDANLDTSDPSTYEVMGQEKAQAASQLISTLMSLAGMADNLGIDIMQEIWDMPWEV